MIVVEERLTPGESPAGGTNDLAAAQALIEEAHRHKRIRRFRIIVVMVVVAVVGSLLVATQVGRVRSRQPLGGPATKTAPSPVFVHAASPWGPPVQVTSGGGALWVTMSAPATTGLPPAPLAIGGIVRIGSGSRPSVRNWAPIAAPQASAVVNGSIWTAGFDTGFLTQVDVHTGRVQKEIAIGPPPSFPGSFTYPDGQFLPSALDAVGNRLWVVSARGYAVDIDPQTDQTIGRFQLTTAVDSSLVASSGERGSPKVYSEWLI